MKGLILIKRDNEIFEIKIEYTDNQQSLDIFFNDFIEYLIEQCKLDKQSIDE